MIIWFYTIIWQVRVAIFKLYVIVHSLFKLEILLLKGDWSNSIIPKQNAVVKYVQALGHWEFNRHAQKHMKRREDIPQIIYPKYYKKSMLMLGHINSVIHFGANICLFFTVILINFLVQTQECTETQTLYLFCPWKYEKIPPIVGYFTKTAYLFTFK